MRALVIVFSAVTLFVLYLAPAGRSTPQRPHYPCSALRDVDTEAFLECRVDYYAAWVRRERAKNSRLRRKLDLTWPGRERDHSRVLAVAAATFPASTPGATRSWLDGCARSEGSRGPWVWNGGTALSALERIRMAALELRGRNTLIHKPGGSSGAGGWWQFMRSTFYANVRFAFRAALRRGVVIPRRYSNWYSRVGQAFTAAYMFKRGWRSAWSGANC